MRAAVLVIATTALISAEKTAAADGTTEAPSHRYGAMTQDECEAELTSRSIPFKRETAKGVAEPIRLEGPLHGVTFRTNQTHANRETTIWEIADCRLVLALDDFASIIEKHDVVEVRHYSMHRAAPKSWPEDKIGKQHIGGLALDAARFIRKDGSYLDVLEHFKGRIGAKTCGPKARKVKTAEANELREIVCAAVDAQLFNVILTPDHNRAHRNHFHLEVTPGVSWMLVR
ncbi:MAG TPA: extensin family protein [Kofleriaceae bacterium]|nr:extensin family protein [Kofleriaceae bacterium]